jgi:hypothetical protein
MASMVFLRTAWMKHYNGVTEDDKPVNGGRYIAENGFGGEVYNFRPVVGKHYGYAQVSRSGRINLERIDRGASDGRLDGVLVVWLARDDRQGAVVVTGWYRNATVYSGWQQRPAGAIPPGTPGFKEYVVEARTENCRLLAPLERTFRIPRARDGQSGFGQSLLWYGDTPDCGQLRRELLAYIEVIEGRKPRNGSTKPSGKGGGWKPIPAERRRAIEKAAMEHAQRWLEDHGYKADDVSDKNLGWDITATQRDTTLRVEVKGLSGAGGCVELTPGEYGAMREHRREYCLCVVSHALDEARRSLRCIRWNTISQAWTDEALKRVALNELIGCRVTLP